MALTSALDITQRGIPLTEPNDLRGRLYYLRGSALNWLGRPAEGLAARRLALEFLQPGSETWFASLGGICYSAAQTGDHDALKNCLAAAEGSEFQVTPTGVWGFAGALFGITLAFTARRTEAERAFHRTYGAVTGPSARLQSTPNDDDDPVFHGWRYLTESIVAGWLHDDLPLAVRAGRASVARFDLAGHRLGGSFSRAFLSGALTWAGAYGSAAECIEAIPPTNTGPVAALARLFDALLREQTGHPYRARLLLDSDAVRAQGLLWSVFGRCLLTACAHREELFPDALRMAEGTRMEAASVAAMIPRCDAIVAAIRGRQGDHLEALAVATRGLEAAQSAAHPDAWSQLALIRAESLHALGRLDEARHAIRSARDRILRIAAAFEREAMPEFRKSWLGNVSQNGRTLELASEWLGEAP